MSHLLGAHQTIYFNNKEGNKRYNATDITSRVLGVYIPKYTQPQLKRQLTNKMVSSHGQIDGLINNMHCMN